jgi:hypothetical protein
MGNLGASEARKDLEILRGDTQEIHIYENGEMEKKTVGKVVSEALGKISRVS